MQESTLTITGLTREQANTLADACTSGCMSQFILELLLDRGLTCMITTVPDVKFDGSIGTVHHTVAFDN